MKAYPHYLMMWLVFSLLFTMAVVGLELLEGNRITTSQYYGLRNIGVIFILFTLLLGMALYPLLFLPLTLLVHRWIHLFPVRLFVYGGVGGAVGIWMFGFLYEYLEDGQLIEAYDLNMASSIILFALAGLFYGLADHFIGKRRE